MTGCEICGVALSQPARGRKRRYCGDSCKSKAKRERNSWAVPGDLHDPVDAATLRIWTAQAVVDELDAATPADPVEQLTRAVGETETLAVQYKRLARVTPSGLAWRASDMADHLRAGLDRLFPREDEA